MVADEVQVRERVGHIAQLVLGGARRDLNQGETVPVALGLGEGDLVRGDRERVEPSMRPLTSM